MKLELELQITYNEYLYDMEDFFPKIKQTYSELKEDNVNPLFTKIILGESVKLFLNPTKRKSKVLINSLLCMLNELSMKMEIELILELTHPIYNYEEYKEDKNVAPVDWESSSFKFTQNGYKYPNQPVESMWILEKLLKKVNPDFNKKEFINGEVFYDCNLPEEIEGYTIKEESEDIYRYVPISTGVNGMLKVKHRTHYIKWSISNDISVRYFYTFDDDISRERNFYLKSHKEKEYMPLTEKQANILIKDMCKVNPIEIVGIMTTDGYKKTLI
jgi:hypothetical protein